MQTVFLSLLSFLSVCPVVVLGKMEATHALIDDGVRQAEEMEQLTQEDTVDNERLLPGERIISGSNALPARYPYYTRVDSSGNFLCGGTLIDPQFVLTAAHCAANSMSVSVGEYYTSDADTSTGIYRSVTGLYRHYAYSTSSLQYDLMLLRLTSPVDSITPVQYNTDSNEPNAGDATTVIGLGRTNPDESASGVLQEVDLNVIAYLECTGQNNDYYRWAPSQVDDSSMFCAGDNPGEQNVCSGDSGGPALKLGATPAQDVQLGLVSWGYEECVKPGLPGVYARTSAGSIWMKNIICTKSDKPPPECYGSDGSIQCSNPPGRLYMGFLKGFQPCSWINEGLFSGLRRWWYCRRSHAAWQHCPDQCGSCSSNY